MHHILKCHPVLDFDFVRARNCHLWDARGRRYLDLESGSWAALLGHCHPRIDQAMKEQIDRVVHLGVRTPNHLAEEAAQALLSVIGLTHGKCVFLSSGSEAVEFAVQAARRLVPSQLLLTFTSSYLAAFGSAGHKSPDEWYLCDWRACDPEHLDQCLAAIPFERIGGFVLEAGGGSPEFVRFPPRPLVEAIARRVQSRGGLVIANEITTGMGRTGKWFGHQHYGITPDLVAVGKGLGNGFPVSAVAMSGSVADALEQSGLRHAQSHQNNPLGCAVALEVIATLREENWIERGKAMGTFFLENLQALRGRFAAVKEARGRGALLALELEPQQLSGDELQGRLLTEGFIAGCYPKDHPEGTGLRFDPALTLEQNEMERFVDALAGLLQ